MKGLAVLSICAFITTVYSQGFFNRLSQKTGNAHVTENALCSLVSFRTSRSNQHLYTGVLFTESHALTAAINVYKLNGPYFDFIQVWAGIVFGKNGGTSRPIAGINYEKEFCSDTETLEVISKIAVVTLSFKIELSEQISVIQLSSEFPHSDVAILKWSQTKKYWIKNVNLITVSSIFIETNLHIHLRDNSDFNKQPGDLLILNGKLSGIAISDREIIDFSRYEWDFEIVTINTSIIKDILPENERLLKSD